MSVLRMRIVPKFCRRWWMGGGGPGGIGAGAEMGSSAMGIWRGWAAGKVSFVELNMFIYDSSIEFLNFW